MVIKPPIHRSNRLIDISYADSREYHDPLSISIYSDTTTFQTYRDPGIPITALPEHLVAGATPLPAEDDMDEDVNNFERLMRRYSISETDANYAEGLQQRIEEAKAERGKVRDTINMMDTSVTDLEANFLSELERLEKELKERKEKEKEWKKTIDKEAGDVLALGEGWFTSPPLVL